MKKRNEILELSSEFALQTVAYCELLEEKRKYVIARQSLKSGTSVGADIREAQNVDSELVFIHKLQIAAKETEETEYWLLLCNKSVAYPSSYSLLSSIISIKKLLNTIISKTKKVLTKISYKS